MDRALGQESGALGSSPNAQQTGWVTLGTLSVTSVFTSVQGEDWGADPRELSSPDSGSHSPPAALPQLLPSISPVTTTSVTPTPQGTQGETSQGEAESESQPASVPA